jgi:sarcosine oxidase subunit beta
MTRHYSALSLIKEGLNHQKGWQKAWRSPEPKSRYDAIIIGGGGHGLATAYYLAKNHGITDVAVIEKGWLGGGNTGRNTTTIRSNYFYPESAALYEYSLKLYESLSTDLNYNIMFSQRGVLTMVHSPGEMEIAARLVNAMQINGIDSDLLTVAEIRKLVPLYDLSPTARFQVLGGVWQGRAGSARHDAVAWGYARAADAHGVDIIQNCEVTGFLRDGDRVVGVETTRGAIAAGRVGICVVGNSGHVAGLAGLKLPIESHTLQAFVTEPVKPMIDNVVMSQSLHCYFSQSDKGGIVGGGDPDRWPSYAQRGQPTRLEDAIAQMIALCPPLSRLRMVRCWAGVTDMSFDGSPIIGETGIPGLYLNGGWCYGGFKATPGSGLAYAHLLATGTPHPAAAPFDLARFAEGRTIDEAGAGPRPQDR